MNKTYLLTGGSGYLGSLLAIELIKKRNKVIFLGRSKDNKSFQDRITKILKKIEPDIPLENIIALEIDLRKKYLGIDNYVINKLAGQVDGFWHLAANLSFNQKDKDKVITTNVNGLKNILSLVEKIKCPINFVSTAYVCGRHSGVFYEESRKKPVAFNNTYEKSKFLAEKTLQEWRKTKHIDFIIFRPSILISTDLKQLNYFGYYNVVYALYKWSQKLKIKPIFIFPYYRKSVLNLMPIESAVEWMLAISFDRRARNRTFHITNPAPPSIKNVAASTYKILNIRLFLLKAPKFIINYYFNLFYLLSFMFPSSKKIARKFYYYKNYLNQDIVFDMQNTKEILGKRRVDELKFSLNFIEDIAELFVNNLNKESGKK